jgi:RnfABCDGE-type electron transport complex B subunit
MRPSNWIGMIAVLTTLAALGGLALVLATLLVVANRRLHVHEDPRIDVVEEMLPAANCGACGYPGCRPFAEALVLGDVLPGKCTVSSEAGRGYIASFLGVNVGAEEKRVARLACAGGSNVARNRAHYHGIQSCAAAAAVAGGGKGCSWGCLGLGDCDVVCDFDAIELDAFGIPVVDAALCTACGDCVEACPKDLFSIHPESHRLWVACASRAAGDEILEDCEVACTACARCAADAPKVVVMEDNLPVVNYQVRSERAAIERCPTGSIVWLEGSAIRKGAAAVKVIRQSPRASAPS